MSKFKKFCVVLLFLLSFFAGIMTPVYARSITGSIQDYWVKISGKSAVKPIRSFSVGDPSDRINGYFDVLDVSTFSGAALDPLLVDHIQEKTAGSGVNIDSTFHVQALSGILRGTSGQVGTGATIDDIDDGANFVRSEKNLTAALKTNYDSAYTHVSSDGTDHTFISQDLRGSVSPGFTGLTLSGNLLVDTILEYTTNNGILAEGIKLLDSFVEFSEIAAPANPAANKARLYTKDVAGITKLFFKDSAGTDTDILASATGATTFLALTDTPSVFTGSGGKVVSVNAAENALEFISVAGAQNIWATITGDLGSTTADSTTDILTIAGSGQVATTINGDTIYIGGTASFNDLTLAGDGGANQTINDKNTITITGGSAITTTVGATDTVTIALNINGEAADTLAAADEFIFYDDTGGHNNKITWTNLLGTISKIGTVTSGTLSTGAAVADVTMSLGSDVDGDVYYRNSNKLTRLAKGTATQVLTMNAGATAPEWAASAGGSAAFWNDDGVTTTYSGATVAYVSSADVTELFPAGKLLKITNSGAKIFYGVVIDSAYTTNTEITILAQQDLFNDTLTIKFADENAEVLQYTDELTAVADSSNAMGTQRLKDDGLLLGCQVRVDTAPTGAAGLFDLHKNGTTTYSSKISVSASANDSTYDRPSTGTGLNLGDRIQFFCDQVGSTIAGGSIRFSCWYIPNTAIFAT